MTVIDIRRGKDIKLGGRPEQSVSDAAAPKCVALKPPDFRYLRPRLKVKQGDRVRAGSLLVESKDDTRLRFVSPGGGTVKAVKLGARRRLLEVVVELDADEPFEEHEKLAPDGARGLSREDLIKRLLEGGLWPLLRERPFSRIADPDGRPKSLFVNAMPADPFDADPEAVLDGQEELFGLGIEILKKLTDGPVHLCSAPGAKRAAGAKGATLHEVRGPYPSGYSAVHVYYVDPPKGSERVWYLGAQDVLSIARFLTTGRFPVERVVALAGPGAREPRLYRTRFGAGVASLASGKTEGDNRFVSGGALTGSDAGADGYLGFYDTQLCVLPEGRHRKLLRFALPGLDRYSFSRAFMSWWLPKKDYPLDTNRNGGGRNFVMSGLYDELCPVDILPAQLVKCLMAGDTEEAEKHGVLDCVECGLCTFACPSKIELQKVIEDGLDVIRKGG